jgi:hypothetical protein
MPRALAMMAARASASVWAMTAPRRLVTPLIPVRSQPDSLVPVIRASENRAPDRSHRSNRVPLRSAPPKSACSSRHPVKTTCASLLQENDARSIRQSSNVTSRRSPASQENPVIRLDLTAVRLMAPSRDRRLARSQRSNTASRIAARRRLTRLRLTSR